LLAQIGDDAAEGITIMRPSQSRFKHIGYSIQGMSLLSRYALSLISDPRRRHVHRDVWLTFDDGPHPNHTPRVLDTLKRHGIKAIFFVIGNRAERHIDIVARMVAEGHLVGNHSYTHAWLNRLDRGHVRDEIVRCDAVLSSVYQGRKLFRPPHGARNEVVDAVAAELGYELVLWNASTRDYHEWYQPRIWTYVGSTMVRLHECATVLMHDDLPNTAAYLDEFLDHVQALTNVRLRSPDTLQFASGRIV
jgi:peptidoglycan-N-acetylglucosamine deacetylase